MAVESRLCAEGTAVRARGMEAATREGLGSRHAGTERQDRRSRRKQAQAATQNGRHLLAPTAPLNTIAEG